MATAENLTPGTVMDALHTALGELGIDADQAVADATLRDDLELDSTEVVQISLELTRRLGFKVRLEDQPDLTLAEIGEYVVRVGAGTAEPAAERA